MGEMSNLAIILIFCAFWTLMDTAVKVSRHWSRSFAERKKNELKYRPVADINQKLNG